MRKSIRYTLATFSALLALAIGYLWLTFASSFGYNPPENLPAIEENATYLVFVYGTLRNRDRLETGTDLFLGRKAQIKPKDPSCSVGTLFQISTRHKINLSRFSKRLLIVQCEVSDCCGYYLKSGFQKRQRPPIEMPHTINFPIRVKKIYTNK